MTQEGLAQHEAHRGVFVRIITTLAAESLMHLMAYPPYSARSNIDDHERILIALSDGLSATADQIREYFRFSTKLATQGWKA